MTGDGDRFLEDPELFDEEGDSMAFGIGLGHGFRQVDPRPRSRPAVRRNQYYYYPGFILGYLLKAGVVAIAGLGVAGGLPIP